jgi:biopolymer transport protein TolR
VRADTSTDYGAVMEVMGVLNSAGYKKIGLVTLQKEQPVAP